MKNCDLFLSSLDKLAETWQPHGVVSVIENGKSAVERAFGYADVENTLPITEKSKFLVMCSGVFSAAALLLLIDKGVVGLGDSLGKYIPEYRGAEKIKLLHLLNGSSGIPCWFNGNIMVSLDRDEKHSALSHEERVSAERGLFMKNRSFGEILSLVNDMPLTAVPGLKPYDTSGHTVSVFTAEIVKRVTGKSIFEYLKENLFDKYGIGVVEGNRSELASFCMVKEKIPVYIPVEKSIDNCFSIDIDGANALARCFLKKQIFSADMWKKLTAYGEENRSFLFGRNNGWNSFDAYTLSGQSLSIEFNLKRGVAITSLYSRQNKYLIINGYWLSFYEELRSLCDGELTYPHKPKMEKYNRTNRAGAMCLSVKDDQKSFVSDAKSSLAWGYSDTKHYKSYVLTDCGVAIGLLGLEINPEKQIFDISIVQIDKKYQGRGYGKIMVKWAVEKLKAAGAKELSIAVNRHNTAARRLYESVGFTAAEVYSEGVFMKMKL